MVANSLGACLVLLYHLLPARCLKREGRLSLSEPTAGALIEGPVLHPVNLSLLLESETS